MRLETEGSEMVLFMNPRMRVMYATKKENVNFLNVWSIAGDVSYVTRNS